MADHSTNVSNQLAQPPSQRGRKRSIAWIFAVGIALLFFAGWWNWAAQQQQGHDASADRSDTDRTDVMTVEAISEGGASLAGRNISIVDARVAQVSGTGRFWVAGSEGEPLLVVMDRPQDAGAAQPEFTIAIGERVSVTGVLRQGTRSDGAAPESQAYVSKEPLHLAATTVQKAAR